MTSLLTLLALAQAAPAAPPAPPAPKPAQKSSAPTAAAPALRSGYVQSVTAPDGTIQMQTAAARLTAPGKPDVWLIGAVHIGTKPYYEGLQAVLNARDVVLFEGVRPSAKTPPPPPVSSSKTPPTSKAKPLYTALSEALGLEFQMNRISYARSGWRNSDLSWDDLDRINKEVGKGKTTGFDTVRGLFDPNSPTAGVLTSMLATATPGMKEALKITMIRLSGTPGAMGMIGAEGSEVILVARNKSVMKELAVEIAKPSPVKSVGVFYGAAHLDALEADLAKAYGYKLAEKRWFTSASADPKKVDAQGQALLDAVSKQMGGSPKKSGR